MDFIKAIILGIIEGLTEFLPISSTGHLIIAGDILNFKGDFAVLFEVVIQLGAILAVIYFYRSKIFSSIKELKPGQSGFELWSKVIIAFLPSAILGLLLKDFIEGKLFTTTTVGVALLLGALLILIVEKWRSISSTVKIQRIEDVTYRYALIIGIAQCMALFPGMSRSASTIIGGIIIGMTLKSAAEFSFFLAIPTMLSATTLSLWNGASDLTMLNWIVLAVGFFVSFITALLVIDKFLVFLTKHSLKPFAYYRFFLGFVILLYFILKG